MMFASLAEENDCTGSVWHVSLDLGLPTIDLHQPPGRVALEGLAGSLGAFDFPVAFTQSEAS